MYSFTSEDLLQYLYGETSTAKTAAIKTALQNDWSLQEKLALLNTSKMELDTLKFSPSITSINNILKYAEKAVEELTTPA
ncbi:MAG: hypothetical protein WCH52_09605 [Bacteroidota bacterium]